MGITNKSVLQQNFIATIAQSLISMDNIEVKIQNAITLFGENLNASRVYIFENDATGRFCNNTYEWCNNNISPQIEELQNFPYEIIPSWEKILDKEGLICATSIYDLPLDLVEALEPQNIKSVYVLPLLINNKRIGFWGFDYCNHHHTWSENEINLIQILGGLLSATFERTQTILELKRSEEDFQFLFENMNSAFAVHKIITNKDNESIDFRVIEANTLFLDWLGKERKEIINKRVKEIYPDYEDKLLKKFGEVALTGKPTSFTAYSKVLDKYFDTSVYCPKPGYFAASISDVTEKRKIEISLAENENRFRTIFEKSTDPITILKGNRFIDCNNSTLSVLKIDSKEEFKNLNPWDISPEYQPDGQRSATKSQFMIKTALAKGFNEFDWMHCDKLGNNIWFNVSLTRIELNGEIVLHTIWRDISKRKKAEKIISDNENHLRQIFNSSQVGITLHIDRKLIYANQYICDWIGYSHEELIDSDSSSAYISKHESELVEKNILEGLKKNTSVLQETRFKTREGKIANALINSSYYNRNNKDEGIISVITDITHQKNIENTLRQSEKRFKTIFNSSSTAIFLIDDGSIVDCNNAALQLFKFKNKKDLLNIHPWDLSPEFQADGTRSNDMTIIQSIIDKSKKKTHTIDWIHQDSTGKDFPAEITFSPIVLDNKTFIFEYIRDASIQEELKESETQLKKANSDKDKFISILGHDISSSIGGSISIINLLESKGLEWKEREMFVNHLFENTRVAFDLVKKIITWGKASLGKEMFSPVEFSLSPTFDSIHKLYSTQLAHKNIRLTINCPINQKIFADTNMVEAILRNLIQNAIKYTQKGGFVKCEVRAKDKFTEIVVSDNGIGMTEKRVNSLFSINQISSIIGTDGEPGTGLGLQIVKEYVDLHGGKIEVDSKIAEGSKFKFSFPVVT